MKLTYLPDEMVIVQDDADRPIVASLSMASPATIAVTVLAKAMAEAPALVCLLDCVLELAPDAVGDRHLSPASANRIRDGLAFLTDREVMDLTLFHYTDL